MAVNYIYFIMNSERFYSKYIQSSHVCFAKIVLKIFTKKYYLNEVYSN